jgi:hypothetical protein
MKKEYIITSFEEQAPKELLERDFYTKAIKPLSFQCRDKKDDSLQAYIAMAQDCPNADIPDLNQTGKGCHVLAFYAIPEEDTGYPAPELLSVVTDELITRIKEWRNESGEPFEYLWFNVNDFESIELVKLMGLIKMHEKIAYKTFEK